MNSSKDKKVTEDTVEESKEEVKTEEEKKTPRLKPVLHCGLGFETVIGYRNVETGDIKKVITKKSRK